MTNAGSSHFPEPAQVATVKRSLPSSPSWRNASPRSYRYVCAKQCPSCGGRLIRASRRLQDRLWSLVVPSMRCRCDRFTCQWIGNLPLRPVPGAGLIAAWLEPGSTRRATVFAVAGMLALTLFAASGPFA